MNKVHVVGRNRLLSVLSAEERQRILNRCEKVHLPVRRVIYKPGAEIEAVYFPLGGMVSLVISSEEGQTVEIGTVGNEGMVGTQLVLGAKTSQIEALMQVGGDVLRMAPKDLRAELKRDGSLRTVTQRFAQALTNQIAQSVLCNRLHSVEERLCRWFLMVHDRVGTDQIVLTQQFVAQMLGVRRPSVTVAAGILQKAGLISYSRGRLDILDRQGLEAGACECYEIVRQDTQRLLEG